MPAGIRLCGKDLNNCRIIVCGGSVGYEVIIYLESV